MPRYGKTKWSGYVVRLFAEEYDIFRLLPIVPYFWDSNINLDMVADPPKGSNKAVVSFLKYKWELRDLDDNVVKSGEDVYTFSHRGINMRKHGAIRIGYLKPQQYYRLYIILTDVYGGTSASLLVASFTIKDRDEVYTQILISLVVIIMGIIIGFVAKGC
jgi:hypothetical protein